MKHAQGSSHARSLQFCQRGTFWHLEIARQDVLRHLFKEVLREEQSWWDPVRFNSCLARVALEVTYRTDQTIIPDVHEKMAWRIKTRRVSKDQLFQNTQVVYDTAKIIDGIDVCKIATWVRERITNCSENKKAAIMGRVSRSRWNWLLLDTKTWNRLYQQIKGYKTD